MLRWAYDTLDEMGATSATATIAAFLADALCLDGRYDEAEEISRISEEAPESDVVTQVLWRTARARAVVERDQAMAEALARDALATAQTTDYPDLEARALMSLAEVVGPGEEASHLREAARRLYERKGNVAAVARLSAASSRSS